MEVETIQPELKTKTKETSILNSGETFLKLEQSIYSALEVYSNVHRGSGFNSLASTKLFDASRKVVLDFFKLKPSSHVVIFCTPRRAYNLMKQLNPNDYKPVSSKDIGLALGVVTLIIKKNALPKGIPPEVGGGTTKLISTEWVIWAEQPDRFEAGTPALINIIAFVKAIQKSQSKGIVESIPADKNSSPEDILKEDNLSKYAGLDLLQKLRKTYIGRDNNVPTTKGLKPYINLDNAASTPTFEPVWEVFRKALQQSHNGQKELVNKSKSICSKFLGAPEKNYDIIFTSNTTESINLAARHINFNREDFEPVVVNTILEHSSNDLPWRNPGAENVVRLSIDKEGSIDLQELKDLLSAYNEKQEHGNKRIQLVAITGASNVLGVCPDLKEISKISHKYGALLLVDAAQLIAHRKIDMEKYGIDLLAFSAHKVYAPFGAGALVAKKGTLDLDKSTLVKIQSFGEENVAGISALAKALDLLQRIGMEVVEQEELKLSEKLHKGLNEIKEIQIYGPSNVDSEQIQEKLGVIAFSLGKMMPPKLAKQLSLHGGIGIRTGCLCSHILVKHILGVSPGLEKFQRIIQTVFPKLKLPGVNRISLGLENTEDDVEQVVGLLKQIAENSTELPKSSVSKTQLQLKERVDKVCNTILG